MEKVHLPVTLSKIQLDIARYKYLYKLTMFVWGWTEMIPNLLRNFIRVCLDLNLYTVCCGLCIEAGYDGGSLFLTLERGTNS